MSAASDDMPVDAQLHVVREAREYSQGTLDHQLEHRHVRPHAGLVHNADLQAVLSFMADSYEPLTDDMPTSLWDIDFVENILKNCGTDRVREALETGNYAYLDYLVGLTNYDPDISGFNALMWLSNWISRTASMNIVAGHMGTGKTDFSLLLAQVWLYYWTHVEGYDRDEVAVITNITTSEEADSILESQSKLVEELEKNKKQLVIIDEASSNFSAYGEDGANVIKQFKRTTRMIRKQDGYLVLIAHRKDGHDIHKDVRQLSDIVYKTDQKVAKIYEQEVEEGEEKKTLTNIPQTDWQSYDTEEESTWKWDLDVEDDEDMNWDSFYDTCLYCRDDGSQCGTKHGINQYGFCTIHEDSDQAQRVERQDDLIPLVIQEIAQSDEEDE